MPLSLLHTIKILFGSMTVFLGLFFSAYLLTQTHARRRVNIWLAASLLALTVVGLGGILDHFVELRDAVTVSAPWLFYADGPFNFLVVPFLFLYVLALTRDDFVFRPRHLWHGLPFLIEAGLLAAWLAATPAGTVRGLVRSGEFVSSRAYAVITVAINVQFFGYLVAALAVVRGYRERIKGLYSAVDRINLSWLTLVLAGLTLSNLVGLADSAAWLAGRQALSVGLYIGRQIVFLGFMSLLFLRALQQPVIASGAPGKAARKKYEKTLLADPLREEYRERLVRFMEERKPFLNPLLSLADLAAQVRIPGHHLSQVLNVSFNQNFFDFVNGYRVRESQRLLSGADGRSRTVLEILYETGFNSKSVFNTAFRKHAGMTPSEFKRSGGRNAG